MQEITLEELLEAGCHFGHQVTRGNPKARDYIYEARDNIHIIDLQKTKEGLEASMRFVKDLAARNGSLIILGTKRQAQDIVKEEVKRAKQQIAQKEPNKIYSVTQRWIGGTLTNFSEVVKNYKKLKDLDAKLVNDEEKAKYTKKEVGKWQKDRQKLESFYGGTVDMQVVPDAVFIVDAHLERIAVLEAKAMGITTVAITDTNANPEIIDYPIPANDDATGSIKLIVKNIIDSWIEGRQAGIKLEEARAKKEERDKLLKQEEKTKQEYKEPTTPAKKVQLVMNEKPKEKIAKIPESSSAKATADKKPAEEVREIAKKSSSAKAMEDKKPTKKVSKAVKKTSKKSSVKV